VKLLILIFLILVPVKAENVTPTGKAMHPEQILSMPWHNRSSTDKAGYIRDLKGALAETLDPEMQVKLFVRIGDVYYNLENYRAMKRWYTRALSLSPSLAETTPIGFRMTKGNRIILRQNSMIGCFCGYFLVCIILVAWGVITKSTVNIPLFLKKLSIITPLFLITGCAVLIADFSITSGSAGNIYAQNRHIITEPVFPLPVLDSSNRLNILIIGILGFLPILIASIYTSFTCRISKLVLVFLIIITILSGWTHFFAVTLFDNRAYQKIAFSHTHLYLKGEIEELIIKRPDKIIAANPDFRESNNRDLENFLKEKTPQLLP